MKSKVFFTITVTIFALATLILTIFNYNPFQAASNVFVIFYTSLFVFLSGLSTILIFFIRYRINENFSQNRQFLSSLRQGQLLATIITILFLLKGLKVLDLWVGIPLVIAIILLELFFTSRKIKKV